MIPKQSAEEFMREFFRARTVELRRELEARAPFRTKFFAEDCIWESRKGTINDSESEKILSVSSSDLRAEIVTRPASPFPKLRYHLQAENRRWLIKSVDLECFLCAEGTRNSECPVCKGTSWRGADNISAQIKAARETPSKRDLPPSDYRRL